MKIYLAWSGVTDSFGPPNRKNGRYSQHGELYAFSTLEKRMAFCDIFQTKYNNYPVKINQKQARSKNSGSTTIEYADYLAQITDNIDSIGGL